MNKTILVALFFITVSSVLAQPKEFSGTKTIYVIFTKDGVPVKAYQEPIDAIHFVNNKPYSYQDVTLYYRDVKDSTTWQPNTQMLLDNTYRPEHLQDKYMSMDTIYIVMQSNFNIADRAYKRQRINECNKYADNFKLRIIKTPYYYRNKRSYEEIYKIKKNRLKQ